MTREPAERGFHAIPCVMQARAGSIIIPLFLVDISIKNQDSVEIVKLLRQLANILKDFRKIFRQVIALVDKDGFFDIYRPLLSGFYPHGIQFEGVYTNEGESKSFVNYAKGPSAGQSAMIVLFDLALGISHQQESRAFQVLLFDHKN